MCPVHNSYKKLEKYQSWLSTFNCWLLFVIQKISQIPYDFVVLWFILFELYFWGSRCDLLARIHQDDLLARIHPGRFTSGVEMIRLPRCQWGNLEINALFTPPIAPISSQKTAIARPLGCVFLCGWLLTNVQYLQGYLTGIELIIRLVQYQLSNNENVINRKTMHMLYGIYSIFQDCKSPWPCFNTR